jgi:lipoprotein-anchoring transpeptidase ErfK/SrfK
MPNPALQPSRQQKVPLPAPRPSRAKPGKVSIPSPLPNAQPMPQYMPKQPVPPPPAKPQPVLPRPKAKSGRRLWLIFPVLLVLVGIIGVSMVGAGVLFTYSRGILPGVSVGHIALSGLSEAQAAARLNEEWRSLTLRDGERTWTIDPTILGITLDAEKTAAAAYAQGRDEGNPMQAFLGQVTLTPVVAIDSTTAALALEQQATEFELPAVNAGVRLVEGKVQATPPQNGRRVDAQATVQAWLKNPAGTFADGTLELVMQTIAPTVTDASAMVAEAERILQNSLDIRVFDPVTGDTVYWSLPPTEWGKWLTAVPNANSPMGLSLHADEGAIRNFLTAQSLQAFDPSRSIDIEQGIASVQTALAKGTPGAAYVVVKHAPRTHTVQAGESIISIAWDYGIPYLYIMEANGGIEDVSIGQQIIIPPADKFLLKPVIPDKRIIVSISQQKTWVYENGQLKWEWVSSTGIASSPTWPGVYQIISHEINAYAGNWNLYMPNFMGVYQPIPGAEFTNGFHGFPTRGGGQLLWENSLGTRVTYGCILLDNTHSQLLYEWAEEGVVVEIQA